MTTPFEQWADAYALSVEPNYCEGTLHDCRAAFAAATDRAARIIEAQDVDPAFKNRMAWAIREQGKLE